MAGLGFKDFAVGEVLTAGDVDGYLMQQAVMRFADSSARGSALGTATGTGVPLAEGMVSYLDDANAIQVYDGTAWNPVGSVLQVVTATDATDRSTTSATFTDANISVSVTPKRSDSTLYVEWTGRGIVATISNSSAAFNLQITDSSNTALQGAEAARFFLVDSNLTNLDLAASFLVRGAVASTDTSTRTYKGRFHTSNGTTTLENATNTGRLVVWEII